MKENNLLIFDTDTVFALATPINDSYSYNLLYDLKKRDKNKPISVLVRDICDIKKIAFLNELEEKIINNFMPGALTIVLKAKDNIKKITNFDTIGVRIPNSIIATNVLKETGPLFATSLNISGKEVLSDINLINKLYKDKVKKIYKDIEVNKSNNSSTVVCFKDNKLIILRQGDISFNDILKVL